MKKVLLVLLMSLMTFGVAVKSMASARLDGMSSDPRLVEDYDLIWMYPNKVLDYKGTADFRLNDGGVGNNWGNGFNEWGGFLIDESTLGGVIGVYVNRPFRAFNTASNNVSNNGISGSDPIRYYWNRVGGRNFGDGLSGPSSSNLLDIFYAKALDGADLGFQLTYGANFVNQFSQESMNLGLAVGLGFKDIGPFSQANIHGSFDFQNWCVPVVKATVHSDAINTIKLGGLASADLDTDNALRLSADVQVDNYDVTTVYGVKNSQFAVILGIGCNHKVNGGKGLVSTGFLMDWLGGALTTAGALYPDNHYNNWNILWNGSIETGINSWLTLRAGLQSALLTLAWEERGNSPSLYDNGLGNLMFNTGATISWQNFVLDMQINVASLEDLISGPNVGAGIFYPGNNGLNAGQGIVAVSQADLKFKF